MLIKSKRVWLAGQFVAAIIEFKDGVITNVLPYDDREVDVDYGDNKVLPGFIDIHCHGAYDFDTNDANEEGLRYWTSHIGEEGVTAFLPTTVTQSEEVLTKALKNVAKVVDEGYEGAEILGVHFEGPYLSKEYKGAQPEEFVVKGDIEQFKRYQEAAKGLIKYITMAPEQDEGYKFVEYLNQNGVAVSIGHSSATYEEALFAYAHGAKSMTHVYNGMTPFNHRKNGIVGGAYRFKNMYGEIIADCTHSTAAALNMFVTAKGPDYSIMITDSLMAKGLPAGTKRIFGGQEITISESGVALLNSGTIAGSTLHMNVGLKNMIEVALIPVDYAINSATINPARVLGVDDRKGSLQVGKDADIVVLDKDYSVVQTYARGKAQL